MYTLNLVDGTAIPIINKITNNIFEIEKNDIQVYFKLNSDNLNLAFLMKDDILDDIFVDFDLQNWITQYDGSVQFKINTWDIVHKETNRDRRCKEKFEREELRKFGRKKK